jgi:hypothetical protein
MGKIIAVFLLLLIGGSILYVLLTQVFFAALKPFLNKKD